MKERNREKIETIHQAALQLTGKIGIAGLKMSDIAKEAGMAIGTLYIYFKSKEELLNDLYKSLKTKTVDRIIKNQATQGIPYKLKFKDYWMASLDYRTAHFEEMIFMEQFSYSPYITEENKQISEKYLYFIQQIIQEGKDQLLVKQIDTILIITTLAGLAREFSLFFVKYPSFYTTESLEKTFEICWDAIKA